MKLKIGKRLIAFFCNHEDRRVWALLKFRWALTPPPPRTTRAIHSVWRTAQVETPKIMLRTFVFEPNTKRVFTLQYWCRGWSAVIRTASVVYAGLSYGAGFGYNVWCARGWSIGRRRPFTYITYITHDLLGNTYGVAHSWKGCACVVPSILDVSFTPFG